MLISELFDLNFTLSAEYLKGFTYPWEALEGISNLIRELGYGLENNDYNLLSPEVWVHKSAVVCSSAQICSPCIIGEGTEIRHCAFIRGSALIGNGCVVGNSTELKNVILFDGVQLPHYNYVGDSILGRKAHFGAGAITSNVKSDRTLVTVVNGGSRLFTGLKKFGAAVGDGVEIGCNSVLNPGTVIGKNTNVYPLSSVRGVICANSIYKGGGVIAQKR